MLEVQLNTRIPEDLVDRLDIFCRLHMVLKRDVIELALRRFLSADEGKAKNVHDAKSTHQ